MNNYKRMIAVFSALVFYFNFIFSYNIYGYTNNKIYAEYIPEDAYIYAQESYQSALEVVLGW